MKKQESQTPITNFGIASLLVIFIVLCLVVFAALSLSTAKNDYDFSQKMAKHVSDYYDNYTAEQQEIRDMQGASYGN